MAVNGGGFGMFSRDKKVYEAKANSETALRALGDIVTHNEWLQIKRQIDAGITSVSVVNGTVVIDTDNSKAEGMARQIEMQLDD
jgi:hypothetical protein